jgi:hypothetical protein
MRCKNAIHHHYDDDDDDDDVKMLFIMMMMMMMIIIISLLHCADQVHNQNAYVRDFYFFRRNFYPQLSLVKMDPEDASLALQKRVLGIFSHFTIISHSWK